MVEMKQINDNKLLTVKNSETGIKVSGNVMKLLKEFWG